MTTLVLLSDRTPGVALPRARRGRPGPELEPLSVESLDPTLALEPEAILVDAGENAPQAWSVLSALRERDARVLAVVILARTPLERYPWDAVADELVFPGAPAAELRVRLAMLRRRAPPPGTAP